MMFKHLSIPTSRHAPAQARLLDSDSVSLAFLSNASILTQSQHRAVTTQRDLRSGQEVLPIAPCPLT